MTRNSTKCEKKWLKQEFRIKMACDHSKWLVIMMSLGVVSQSILLILDLSSLSILKTVDGFLRIMIIIACVVFVAAMIILRKRAAKGKNVQLLIIVKSLARIYILTVGTYITITLYSKGMYSFTPFIITSLIVAFTNAYWSHVFNVFVVALFSTLTIFIRNTFMIPEYFVKEVHLTTMLIVLICVAEVLIYNKHWQVFLSENKITDMNKQLVTASQIDELTGIYNRRRLTSELNCIIESTKSRKIDFCVVMVDLDHFKNVNDNFGHILGDEILKQFTALVKENLRKEDIFGRWGGEEFIIIIPETDKDSAFKFVERIRKLVAEHEFEKIGKLTFSAGICEFVPEYTDDKLIDNADFALYISKHLGRNQVHIYS